MKRFLGFFWVVPWFVVFAVGEALSILALSACGLHLEARRRWTELWRF